MLNPHSTGHRALKWSNISCVTVKRDSPHKGAQLLLEVSKDIISNTLHSPCDTSTIPEEIYVENAKLQLKCFKNTENYFI